MKDLSIIILNYNTKDLLLDCLRSVIQATKNQYHYQLIVVDNASTDGSAAAVRQFSQLKLIQSKKNLGFAAGNNLAIPYLQGRYALFLNPDTVVFPDTFTTMIAFMNRQPAVGVATCRVELADGRLDEGCHRGFPTPWNAFCHFSGLEAVFPHAKLLAGYTLGHLPLTTVHPIDACSGSFFLIRCELGQKLGWWDQDYFWYGEDLDFCYRVRQAGEQVYFVPTTKIIHYKGVASGIKKHSRAISTASKQTRQKALADSVKVMRIFYQKHYRNKYPAWINWLTMRGIDLLGMLRRSY